MFDRTDAAMDQDSPSTLIRNVYNALTKWTILT